MTKLKTLFAVFAASELQRKERSRMYFIENVSPV